MLLKLYSSSLTIWSALCYCSVGSGSDNRFCPSSELHSPAFPLKWLLNPTTKCVPCSFSRGFNNLDCPCLLLVSLGRSCVPLLLLSLVPHPSSSAVISAPWCLSWFLQGWDREALPLVFLESGLVPSSASLAASSGLCCIWPLAPVSVPDGAWAGRDPVASWAAQRANLPCRTQSTCVLRVYTGFLCLIFGMFLWFSQQHFGILAEPEVKQIEPALSL